MDVTQKSTLSSSQNSTEPIPTATYSKHKIMQKMEQKRIKCIKHNNKCSMNFNCPKYLTSE